MTIPPNDAPEVWYDLLAAYGADNFEQGDPLDQLQRHIDEAVGYGATVELAADGRGLVIGDAHDFEWWRPDEGHTVADFDDMLEAVRRRPYATL